MEERVVTSWVLQAASGEDFLRSLKEGKQQHWWLKSQRTGIVVGDRIFFWQAGAKAALLGKGVVTKEPYENPEFSSGSTQPDEHADTVSDAPSAAKRTTNSIGRKWASPVKGAEKPAHSTEQSIIQSTDNPDYVLKNPAFHVPTNVGEGQKKVHGGSGKVGGTDWRRERPYRFEFRTEGFFDPPVTRTQVAEHSALGKRFLNRLRGGVTKLSDSEAVALAELAEKFSQLVPPSTKSDNVPTHGDHPAIRDALGRNAFARVIAARIERLRDDEKWDLSNEPPTPFWGFVRGKVTALWRSVRDVSRATRSPPLAESGAFMVHIHGPWGSGKTSLLNFVREELQKSPDSRWIVVNFNAWRFQRLGAPWWSLLLQVYQQARDQLSEIEPLRARELLYSHLWWRVFTSWAPWIFVVAGLLWLLSAQSDKGIAVIKDVAPLVTVLSGLWTLGRSVLFGSARATNAILEIAGDPLKPLIAQFKETVWRVNRPLLVFIDDLDRCDAEYVVSLLHGIQTMFWGTQVAYVVAADRHWLRAAYETTYEQFDNYVGEAGRPLGYLFLEKVFQLSVSVPRLSKDTRDAYWGTLIGGQPVELDSVIAEAEEQAKKRVPEKANADELMDAAEEVNQSNAQFLVKHKVREIVVVRLASREIDKETEHELRPFAQLLEPNPRAMKRMVNAYAVHRAIDILAGRRTPTDTLARWTIMELRWPLLAEWLAVDPERVTLIREGKSPKVVDKTIESLKPLFSDEGVKKVVVGSDKSKGLVPDSIRECIGRHPAEPSGSTVA